ncbi:MAG: CapA family protein [bacterium]|jgi:poly-gamma-glutamate synthesis protein (capsule biosynthesis protein)|nr:CapA family protein [candidate division KSB1 bacterium]MDH7559009.1 CapA family protein [bacterium]
MNATFSVAQDTVRWRRSVETISERKIVSIAAVGDVMLAGAALCIVEAQGCGYPFDSTRALLQSADVAIGNLEAPFTTRGKAFDKTFTFRVPPPWAAGLKNAGFDVLNLANNHILDYGHEGLFDTIATLDSLGLLHCGAGANDSLAAAPALVKVGDKTVAFLGFSTTFPEEFWATHSRAGTCFPSEQKLRRAIQESRARADLVVVSFHWGAELFTMPKDYQRLLGHQAIDCGADLVLGHHAHVLQGLEVYRGKLIAYGLGNFAFGSRSESSRESMILKVYLDEKGPLLARVIPISVYYREVYYQPRLLRGEARAAALARMAEISAPLNNGRQILDDYGFVLFSPEPVGREGQSPASE